ncbi:glycosyltransferase family 2 protein [candidate division KSB1 bacterium]|nr:glycosyltransferase family 2 protein [candidate division KSB1 bacterium]
MSAKVGIIVLNWNGLADTGECLRSLFATDPALRVIYVIDNGSTDGSATELHREFGESIILIANPRNLLYAGGNNVGITRALADGCSHLLLLNNDTTVAADLLQRLLDGEAQTGDAVLCPKIYYARDPQRLWYAGGLISLRRARLAHRGIRELDRGQYDQLERTGWATGCALFGSRRLFETVGMLDTEFALYMEDVDFSLRARAAGFPCYYVPAAKVWHKVSASMGGNLSKKKLSRKWASLRRLVNKHLPSPAARFAALTDFVLTEPPRVLWAGMRGKLK